MHTFGWFFNDQPVTKVVSLQDDSRLPNPCSSAVRETNESTDHCESLCFHSCPPGYHLFEIHLYWSWFFWICFAMERAHMLWYMLYDWMATLYIYTLETQNLEIIRICFDTRVLDRMFFENLQLPSKPGFSHQILDFRLSSTRSTLFVHRIWTKCSGTQPFLGSWSDGVQEALEKLMVSFLKHFGSSCFKVEL